MWLVFLSLSLSLSLYLSLLFHIEENDNSSQREEKEMKNKRKERSQGRTIRAPTRRKTFFSFGFFETRACLWKLGDVGSNVFSQHFRIISQPG